jgi:phosphate transport system protein
MDQTGPTAIGVTAVCVQRRILFDQRHFHWTAMRHFDEQLQDLLQTVAKMGRLAESMIESAIGGLVHRKPEMCDGVFAMETEVNSLQVEVDDRAVKLTVLHQPVAQDARFLFMASRIGGELERIADQAINVCQSAKFVLEGPALEQMVDVTVMAEVARKMVLDSLSAMVGRDVSLAMRVLEDEKRVDALRNQIFRTLLTYMMSDPRTIPRALALILISRNLERVGDHATNIAEEVIYWIQGRDVRHGNASASTATLSASTATFS